MIFALVFSVWTAFANSPDYDRLLLERLEKKLYFYQFGMKRPLPKNMGKTISFTRQLAAAWRKLCWNTSLVSVNVQWGYAG